MSPSDMRVEFTGNGWEKLSDMFHVGINTSELWAVMASVGTETPSFRLLVLTITIDHFSAMATVFRAGNE